MNNAEIGQPPPPPQPQQPPTSTNSCAANVPIVFDRDHPFETLPIDCVAVIIYFVPEACPVILLTHSNFQDLWVCMFNDKGRTKLLSGTPGSETHILFRNLDFHSNLGKLVFRSAYREHWLKSMETFEERLRYPYSSELRRVYARFPSVKALDSFLNQVSSIIRAGDSIETTASYPAKTALRVITGHFSLTKLLDLDEDKFEDKLIQLSYVFKTVYIDEPRDDGGPHFDELVQCFELAPGGSEAVLCFLLEDGDIRTLIAKDQLSLKQISRLAQHGAAKFARLVSHRIFTSNNYAFLKSGQMDQLVEIACKKDALANPIDILRQLFDDELIQASLLSDEIELQDILDLFKPDDPLCLDAYAFCIALRNRKKLEAIIPEKMTVKQFIIIAKENGNEMNKNKVAFYYDHVKDLPEMTAMEKSDRLYKFAGSSELMHTSLVYQVMLAMADDGIASLVLSGVLPFDDMVNIIKEDTNQSIETWLKEKQSVLNSGLYVDSGKDPYDPDAFLTIVRDKDQYPTVPSYRRLYRILFAAWINDHMHLDGAKFVEQFNRQWNFSYVIDFRVESQKPELQVLINGPLDQLLENITFIKAISGGLIKKNVALEMVKQNKKFNIMRWPQDSSITNFIMRAISDGITWKSPMTIFNLLDEPSIKTFVQNGWLLIEELHELPDTIIEKLISLPENSSREEVRRLADYTPNSELINSNSAEQNNDNQL